MYSCTAVQNANNTQKGAGLGAVAGGVIGGILGNNIGKGGNTALGAVDYSAAGGSAGCAGSLSSADSGYVQCRNDERATLV